MRISSSYDTRTPVLYLNWRDIGLQIAWMVGCFTVIFYLWGALVDCQVQLAEANREVDRQAGRASDAWRAIGESLAVTSQVACIYAPPVVWVRDGEKWVELERNGGIDCWDPKNPRKTEGVLHWDFQ